MYSWPVHTYYILISCPGCEDLTLLSRFIHLLNYLLSYYIGGTQIIIIITFLILDGT